MYFSHPLLLEPKKWWKKCPKYASKYGIYILKRNYFFCLIIFNFTEFTSAEAPVVNKLFVPSNLALNDILELLCTVKRGDPPLNFRWLHNGRDVTQSKHRVTTLGSSSHLSIGKIETEDVGNYTCIVSNSMGSNEVTANIVIEGIGIHEKYKN